MTVVWLNACEPLTRSVKVRCRSESLVPDAYAVCNALLTWPKPGVIYTQSGRISSVTRAVVFTLPAALSTQISSPSLILRGLPIGC